MANDHNAGLPTIVDTAHTETPADQARETVIPLFEERLAVTRQVVPTARVQVSRVTHSREELVDELLSREKVEVEPVAIGQTVETMPPVREEGDYLIIPVVEEVLKIERVLVLKEEVRIAAFSTQKDIRNELLFAASKQSSTVCPSTARKP
jgi:stress response protein YsnF